MSTGDPLISAKLKIGRADQEIVELQGRINAFVETNPYRVTEEFNPDGIHVTKKLWFEPIPPEISDSASTACSFLRSSLDKIACALAVQNDPSVSIRDVAFPISNSKADFESAREQRKIGKLSAKAQAFIHKMEPYKGGNNGLWAMNEIRKADIHHNVLLAVGAQIQSFRMTGPIRLTAEPGKMAIFRGPGFSIGGAPPRLEDGADLFTIPVASLQQQPDFEFAVQICVRDIDFANRVPVVEVVTELTALTKSLVEFVQREFFS